MGIANNGDISFYEDTGTTAKFFWDASAERLGIGTGTANAAIEIRSNAEQSKRALRIAYDGTYYYEIEQLGSGGVAYNAVNATAGGHRFEIDGSEKMRLDYAGNVGIGTSTSLDNKLEVNGGNVRVRGTSTPSVKFNNGELETVAIKLNSGATGTLGLRDNKVLIDSSGNLLVGKTAASSNTVGFETSADGTCAITRSGGQPLLLNRQTSDGDIILLRKDGTTVGNIGTFGSALNLGTGSVGLSFYDGVMRYYLELPQVPLLTVRLT